jgi:transposase-like protein
MASTRSGISAKQLERELGVTYKTAWRMFRQIRSMMGSDGDRLSGIVEIDETYVGGVQKGKVGRPTPTDKKKPVLGMVERGGRVRAAVVKEVSTPGMIEYIRGNVEKGSKIMTDELNAYNVLRRVGYDHSRIHHRTEYVRGNIHTNSVEGFWSQLKLGLRGVYRQVSPKYLQSYADEYAFRYSHRNHDDSMFMLLLRRV